MKRFTYAAALITAIALSGPVAATTHHSSVPPSAAATSLPLTDGEVRKVDKDSGKLTIRHGAIINLDMPAMTMVFRVSDPAFLDKVRTGDKIRFVAEKEGGAFLVTRIEAVH
jgi:Cu(I)/Ag(I) efflux system periplasmic protein CusF